MGLVPRLRLEMLRDPSRAKRGKPTHEGFAGPDAGDSDPCSPFAGFRVGVCVFSAAWRTETLKRPLGPGNRHKVLCRLE